MILAFKLHGTLLHHWNIHDASFLLLETGALEFVDSVGTSSAVALTASRNGKVARFQTNSPVVSAFTVVSLRRPVLAWLAENIT